MFTLFICLLCILNCKILSFVTRLLFNRVSIVISFMCLLEWRLNNGTWYGKRNWKWFGEKMFYARSICFYLTCVPIYRIWRYIFVCDLDCRSCVHRNIGNDHILWSMRDVKLYAWGFNYYPYWSIIHEFLDKLCPMLHQTVKQSRHSCNNYLANGCWYIRRRWCIFWAVRYILLS